MELEPLEIVVRSIDRRVVAIDDRVTAIDHRVTAIDHRVTAIDHRVTAIDHRLANVEQVLPTLPTKVEVEEAIAAAVAPLATKVELKDAIAIAVAPLATRAEMREAIATAVAPLATKGEIGDAVQRLEEKIDRQAVETRRHFEVVAEGIEHQIKLLAEGITGVREEHDRRFEKVEQNAAGLDGRVMTLEADRHRKQ